MIGAGLSGLAIAALLAAKGYGVQVVEANNYAGGKATAFEMEGFRFDAGPSLFTVPAYVDDIFTRCGKDPREYYRYRQLDTLCHYFYEDGTFIKCNADTNHFADEIERNTTDSAASVRMFLAYSKAIHTLTEPIFIRSSLHKLSTYLKKETLRGMLHFGRADVFTTMAKRLESLFTDPRTIQLFSRYATYNGSNPYKVPATLNLIPHLEHGIGAFLPEGGIHGITQGLFQLCTDLGVHFHFGEKAEKILTAGKQVTGVQTDKQYYAARHVVSNMDVVPTYTRLLNGTPAPEKTLKQERSSSALIFYWGMDRSFPELDLHNIFFTEDYPQEFHHLFDLKTLYKDPTVYINITSKYLAEDAPAGKENWFVMINAPHDNQQDWDQLIAQARENICDKLSRRLGTDVRHHMVCERILDPTGIERSTASHLGSLYGTSSNNRFAAFLRHPNFSSRINGLYFCGGSVHPGGGIPMVMSSAVITASLIK